MDVKQVYSIVNESAKEWLGKPIGEDESHNPIYLKVNEDLSNIVDIGNAVFGQVGVDRYVKKLIDQIGKVVFDNRPYTKNVPEIYRDSFEFGCIVEKIRCELPEATENESWELTDNTSYDPNVFVAPKVSAKFFKSKVTFEIPISITERQVKSAFQNAGQLSGFVAMLYNAVDKAMKIRMDGLVMKTIGNLACATMLDETTAGLDQDGGSSVKAINLLWEYNENYRNGEDAPYLTVDDALVDREFLRYACYRMKQMKTRLSGISTLYNCGKKVTQTSGEQLHTVLHTDFVSGAECYMKADIFHEGYLPIPDATVVPYWQASGEGTNFDTTSVVSYKIKTVDSDGDESTANVTINGLIGIMFDHEACGVANTDNRVTSNYNPKAEFTNSWFKADASYFNDLDYNCVIFYIDDTDHTNA